MLFYLDIEKIANWIIKLVVDEERKPYIDEKVNSNTWVRTFDPSVSESDEYIWHRDKKDRVVTVLEGQGWKFQFDEQIPQVINSNDKLQIPKLVYHRLILGNTKLKLKIEEID
jgi:hypothetical protein